MKSRVRHYFSAQLIFVALLALSVSLATRSAAAQNGIGEGDMGGCTLKNYVYTCNAADLQKALSGANSIAFEIHNADGSARKELKQLVEDKLHKTVAADGAPADLVFLLEPIDQGGQVMNSAQMRDLGTLRIYSTTVDGRPAHLLWAETYQSDPNGQDLPWPIVAHGLVTRFEKRFQIK